MEKLIKEGGMAMQGFYSAGIGGLEVILERWNSPNPKRRKIILKYHTSGRVVEYDHKQLTRVGAMTTSIQDSTFKRIYFIWYEDGWEWRMFVENGKYRLVFRDFDPIVWNQERLEENKWYKALRPFLGEFATIGLLAYELDNLVEAEKIQEQKETQTVSSF